MPSLRFRVQATPVQGVLRKDRRGVEADGKKAEDKAMIEFKNPIPVKTALGDGMAIYVANSGSFANDIWTIVLNDGTIRHFRTDQVKMEANATWNIRHRSPL